jgi:glyoxylase-like metal-dependent hydrolase (beta-lactamase superfamily II)
MADALPLHATDVMLGAHVDVLVGQSHGKYPDGNSMLVTGSDGVALIDPSLTVHLRGGAPTAVDRVLVSHAHEDHMAGIGAVAGAKVHVHRADLAGVRSMDGLMTVYGLPAHDEPAWRDTVASSFHFTGWPNAEAFDEGDVFDLGRVQVRVMHLPGHTRGHSAFVVEPDGVAFVGDIDLSSFGPYYGDHWSDLDDFVASIARVRDLDARHYVTFHHKGIVDGRERFVRMLDSFAAVIDQRDDRLLAMLEAPRPLAALAAEGIVYRPGSRPAMFGDSVESRTIAMHLRRLVARGALVEHDGVFGRP